MSCGRPHRTRRAGATLAALVALACGDAVAPGTRVCAEILALQVPDAELVEAWPGARGVALAYRVPGEDLAGVHRLECLIEESAPGRLRARSVRVDDRALSEAELLLVNSELVLTEMGADRGAQPSPGSESTHRPGSESPTSRRWDLPRLPRWDAPHPPLREATLARLHEGALWMEAALSRLYEAGFSTLYEWRLRTTREASPSQADPRV